MARSGVHPTQSARLGAGPHTLVIGMTYLCNLVCRHCSVCCGPKAEVMTDFLSQIGYEPEEDEPAVPTLEEDRILNFIEQASDYASLRALAFTGGEPTLFYATLLKAVRLGKNKGLWTGMVTNASWAKSKERAEKRCGELRAAGLDQICFSCGDFHGEFVPVETLRNCYAAALEAGLEITFNLILQANSVATEAYLRRHLEIPDDGAGGRVTFRPTNVVPSGRGAQLPESAFIYEEKDAPNSQYGPCSSVGAQPHITPDGLLKACCGVPAREIGELTLGDLKRQSFREAYEPVNENLIIQWLHYRGPHHILKKLAPDRDHRFTNVCEGCQLIFNDEETCRQLHRLIEETPEVILEDLFDNETPDGRARRLFLELFGAEVP